MNTGTRLCRSVLWDLALLALVSGCARFSVPALPLADVAQQRRQRAGEAVRDFESKRDQAELQAALAYLDQDDLEACQQGLRRLLQRNPDHRDARLLLAELSPTDERQAALNRVDQDLPARPNDARVQYATGLLLGATGQGNSALAYYERAVELEPDNQLYTGGYQAALTVPVPTESSPARSARQPDDSSQAWDGPAVAVPDPTAQTGKLARSLARPNGATSLVPDRRDGSAGSETVAAADDTLPPSASPFRAPPTKTTDGNDPADSVEAAAAAPPRALLGKGRTAPAEGSPGAATAQLGKAAAVRPNNPQIPISAAVAALRHNQPELAIELLRPAEPRFSGSAQFYRILGLAYYRMEDYRSSQVALRQALSLDKSSALSYFLMGCTLSKLGQVESAEAHLRQAQTIDPRYAVRR